MTRAKVAASGFAIVLGMLGLGACAPAERPATPAPAAATGAAIRTDRDRYVLEPAPIGRQVAIVATFTAPAETVYVVNCNGAFSWGLQRQDGDTWVDAWVTALNGCLSPAIVIPAGAARVETLFVVSRTDVPGETGPIRHAIAPGTYRVVWHQVLTAFDMDTHPFGPELSLERRVSAPITIEGGP